MKMLLTEIEKTGKENRKAHFSCVLALACPNEKVRIFEGRVDGRIADQPSGKTGFGYDPVFVPEGSRLTLAEITPEEKNSLSHRAMAARRMLQDADAIKKWLSE
jgi:XTP/dITP diphosphohydrolase